LSICCRHHCKLISIHTVITQLFESTEEASTAVAAAAAAAAAVFSITVQKRGGGNASAAGWEKNDIKKRLKNPHIGGKVKYGKPSFCSPWATGSCRLTQITSGLYGEKLFLQHQSKKTKVNESVKCSQLVWYLFAETSHLANGASQPRKLFKKILVSSGQAAARNGEE
jgi:hypothetical protein